MSKFINHCWWALQKFLSITRRFEIFQQFFQCHRLMLTVWKFTPTYNLSESIAHVILGRSAFLDTRPSIRTKKMENFSSTKTRPLRISKKVAGSCYTSWRDELSIYFPLMEPPCWGEPGRRRTLMWMDKQTHHAHWLKRDSCPRPATRCVR